MIVFKKLQQVKEMITTGSLLDYIYFKNYYKMIAIDLSKNKHLMLIQKKHRKLDLLEI